MTTAKAAPRVEPSDNPFLQGNFAPVPEESTLEHLPVEGTLPKALRGQLLRNGPNPTKLDDPDYHWFTGDAMLHAVAIEDGRATHYRNRWIRTPQFQEATGRAAANSGVQPLPLQGNGNVNVIGHAGRILALPEVGLPFEMTADLETVGLFDFGGRLASNMTAHPKIDGQTGELIFFGYDVGDVHLRYHVADRSGAIIHSECIDTPQPTMMHDFGVTATRVIFMDFPVVFDLDMVALGRRIPFRWRDDTGARLGVMPRRGTSAEVIWIDIPPCYVYHPMNAYDDGENIVFDVVKHEKTFVDGRIELDLAPPALERWTIDPGARRVTMEAIDPLGQEFPRVNPRFECHPHRYGYGVRTDGQQSDMVFGDLLKYDMRSGTTTTHDVGSGCAAGEGVFVPVGDGEDEGYVLAPVYDRQTGTSHIRVIDATDFAAEPIAKIMLPVRIPYGFHGNFV
ncbi:MAG: carotenoid oxygenase family protein [Myxococcales bacterium]|nr:carotenoid oxygenase family protein [Myxococcales bacterium]